MSITFQYCVSSNVVGKISNIQAQEVADITHQFEELYMDELEDTRTMMALEKQKTALENRLKKLQNDKEDYQNRLTDTKDRLQQCQKRQLSIEKVFENMKSLDNEESKKLVSLKTVYSVITFKFNY